MINSFYLSFNTRPFATWCLQNVVLASARSSAMLVQTALRNILTYIKKGSAGHVS